MRSGLESVGVLAGRTLLSLIFLASGAEKILNWSETADSMKQHGMVVVPVFLAGAIVFELAGGLSVLVGYRARIGSLLLIVFLIPTTLIFHNFWSASEADQQMQMIMFLKNVAILGGLLSILSRGPGPLSFDAVAKLMPRKTSN